MDPFAKAMAPIYRALGDELQRANAADFDDLLVLPVRMLQQHPDGWRSYRERFQYILVDEYQDTNRAQYELIKLLGGEHGNVCVVGDDDQSIYGWRGADIRNILDFAKDFPERGRRAARGELPLDAADSRAGERRDQRQHRAAWERRCAPRTPAARR